MQVEETERTAGYRFWFDVREPGAAAYASQLGAHALYFALIFFMPRLSRWFGYWSWIAASLVVVGLMGALRRLELWAAVAVAAVAFLPPLGLVVYGFRESGVDVVIGLSLLAVMAGLGLPMAIWAAWVHRELSREERWELVGLKAVPEGTPRWKRWVKVWWGAARPW